jgi:hypothetical protein
MFDNPSPLEQVVLKIAEQKGVEPTELPPLYDTVDPEPLNELLTADAVDRLTFEYVGYKVTFTSPDHITISEGEVTQSPDNEQRHE